MNDFPAKSPTSLIALFVICMTTLFAGCGGGSATPTPQQPASTVATEQQVAAPVSSSPNNSDIGRKRLPNERWTDANGVEYLGNVPLDVFFDQPYSVVQDSTPVGNAGTPAVAATDGNMSAGMSGGAVQVAEADPATAEPESGSGEDSWAELIPIETLLEEVNSSRNFMKESLLTIGAYNSSMLMIPPKAAGVAALATIVLEHPGEVTWKEDAAYIRDFAKQMNESTLQRGKKDQSRLLRLFENMSDTLNRSRPADLPEPPETDSYADVAEMRLLMMRMESAEKRMKNEAGTETAFGTQKDIIMHEAAILGTMSKVVTMPGYGYEDDPEFVGYAKRIIDAAKAIRVAAEVNDFASYEQSLSSVATACTECHSAFKNN